MEGFKVQVAPSGNPEQVRRIGRLNSFSGINVASESTAFRGNAYGVAASHHLIPRSGDIDRHDP